MTETARMLALLNDTFPDLTVLSPQEARAAADARIRPAANLDDVASAEDVRIDADGVGLSLRVYYPHSMRSGAPVTVYAHGGGFLHGSIEGHDSFCRSWAKGTEAAVVSVEYRVSTQARPPAARDDVLAAVDWTVDVGLASNGVLLGGDSSGANLAASAAISLRDRGGSPVVAQALLYPFLDPTMSTESHRTRASGYFVTAELLAYYWQVYLGDRAERIDSDITPLAVDDLSGLPSTIIVTAGLDPLCDEGAIYAARLRESGVPVLQRHYPDQFHGFLTIPAYGPATSAQQMLWSDLRRIPTLTKES